MSELYMLTEENETWYLTSSDSDQDHDGNTYSKHTIDRTEIQEKGDSAKSFIDVTFDIYSDVARRWLTIYSDYSVSLTIFEKKSSGTLVIWKGRLLSVKPSNNKLILHFESVFTSMKRPSLVRRYQKTCPHSLYHRGCNLNSEDFAILTHVSDVNDNGTIFTIPQASTFDDGYYIGGMMRAPDETLRMIVNHVGETITVSAPFISLKEEIENNGYGLNYGNFYGGVGVKIYPGCDLILSTCRDKFDNILNFGGEPWIPSKNPTAGSSII